MLFNSIHFAIFLPIVFAIYWLIHPEKVKLQNLLLLSASYYFYSCWDYRFTFLLLFSTVLDYVSGIRMHSATTDTSKKIWFWSSIAINLGFLGIFKYYNFFAASFGELLQNLGFQVNFGMLEVILPVGISFYTFHGLSYVIDIYKNRIVPERDFVNYGLFVSFFPLLVAGPIERATHLLPQIKARRMFNYQDGVIGLRQILWGLFKKIVIADNCAAYVNDIFAASDAAPASLLVAGAVLFAFQIYGDFSGYSDIALGTARLFGFRLLRNFAYPYFSRDIAEFWRRWHISLSSWFKDYLYIPLGGSRRGLLISLRNTFIIFIVSGIWHGANWTFVVWGFLNAVYFLPLLLFKNNRNNLQTVAEGRALPSIKEAMAIIVTFAFVCLAWIFFRADSVSHALHYIAGIFDVSIFSLPTMLATRDVLFLFLSIGFMLVVEWCGRSNEFGIQVFNSRITWPVRYAFYYSIIVLIFWLGGNEQQFIYFQF